MRKKIFIASAVAIFAAMIYAGFISFGGSSAQAEEPGRHIVVTLKGLGLPVDTPQGVSGDCFKTDLFDTKKHKLIGDGLDCLVVVDSTESGMLLVDRTTVFNFNDGKRGRLVARGMTTVVPIFGASSPLYSHVVGDVDSTTSNIVSALGTKDFKRRTGSVRLSGIVNLVDHPGKILFNCIFVIEFD